MSLPAFSTNSFLQRKNLEALALPAFVVLFLIVVLIVSIVLPQQKQEKDSDKQKELAEYTKREKVESEGKIIEVTPRVLQITPESLKQSLEAKENIKLIQVINKGDEWKEPHIKGTIFMLTSAFDSAPSIEREGNHIFISSEGYESAVAIDKIVKQGFPRDRNYNLEGGLASWKKKGFPLEN